MHIKLDENLGRTPQRLLQERGHGVENVYDEGLSGADDPTVWEQVQQERRFFITLDTDFADVRRYVPGTHPGILLLRPRSKGRDAAARLLQRVVEAHPLDTLGGCLTVASEAHTRIRRPSEDAP